jgi:hypothetical protein
VISRFLDAVSLFYTMPQVKICPNCRKHIPPYEINCGCGYPLDNVDPVWVSEAPAAPESETSPEKVATVELNCAHPDCGAVNPGGSANCRYCGRPLSMGYCLDWPWGESMLIQSVLFIGREPPVPPDLAARLEREYPNVSRRHAEFSAGEQGLWVRDLGSSNGTFVNGQRLTAQKAHQLKPGDRVRFAAQLVVTIRQTTP